jgi:hypothetical protein
LPCSTTTHFLSLSAALRVAVPAGVSRPPETDWLPFVRFCSSNRSEVGESVPEQPDTVSHAATIQIAFALDIYHSVPGIDRSPHPRRPDAA